MAKIDSKKQLEELITEMRKTFDEADSANKRSYAANVLKGLIREYEDRFAGREEEKSNLKSVKNF